MPKIAGEHQQKTSVMLRGHQGGAVKVNLFTKENLRQKYFLRRLIEVLKLRKKMISQSLRVWQGFKFPWILCYCEPFPRNVKDQRKY